jgi:hypothetical protein
MQTPSFEHSSSTVADVTGFPVLVSREKTDMLGMKGKVEGTLQSTLCLPRKELVGQDDS